MSSPSWPSSPLHRPRWPNRHVPTAALSKNSTTMGLAVARILHQQTEVAHAAAATNPRSRRQAPHTCHRFRAHLPHHPHGREHHPRPGPRETAPPSNRSYSNASTHLNSRKPSSPASLPAPSTRSSAISSRDLGLRDYPPSVTHKRRAAADIARLDARAAACPPPTRRTLYDHLPVSHSQP